MALLNTNLAKCLQKSDFVRKLNRDTISLKSLRYPSQVSGPIKNTEPVKYTTNEAYNIQISETLGFQEEKKTFLTRLPKYLFLFSSFGAFVYFTLFREENEIDEILSGTNQKSVQRELLDLKIKLTYCKNMKLPTDAIRARIKELENILPKDSSSAK